MKLFGLLFFTCLSHFASANKDSIRLIKMLNKVFPGVEITAFHPVKTYPFVLQLKINQLLDHHHPERGTFPQLMYLYHKDFKAPNVLSIEGYRIADRFSEASLILKANQFTVEYRFSGSSVPDSVPWDLMRFDQVLEDLHLIQNQLSKIYKKSWTATGTSKAGTTAALYSVTFPKDVKATIAYVAPFVLAQEDQRTTTYYQQKVGTKECRDNVHRFQRSILEHRDELIPMLEELAKNESVSFPLGTQKTLEYTALEFPFSFWQWGFQCSDLPNDNPTAQEIFDLIEQVVDFNFYDDKTFKEYQSSYYFFMTEFGYYGFDTTGLNDLLIYEKNPSNLSFCPPGIPIIYHPEYMIQMTQKLEKFGKNILYIYGAQDSWYSCAMNPSPKSNCKKYVQDQMGHRTKIRNFTSEQKNEIYKLLHHWTHSKTYALPY